MENKRLSAVALIIIGLGAVNFFYLADLLVPDQAEPVIILGWKSGIAIVVANLIALYGAWRMNRTDRQD